MKAVYSIILIFFLFSNHSSFAQGDVKKHPLLTDRFVFTGGMFLPIESLKISVNGQTSDDIIDLGDAFNLNKYTTTFDIGFDWRFAKKWTLAADYFRANNSTTVDLDEPIVWEDYTFEGEAKLDVDIGVLRTMVNRVLSQGDKHELGVGLGVHMMFINISIEGEASLEGPGEEIETGIQKGKLDVTAPLPNIGLYYNWAPTPKWYFKADIDWLYVGIGDFKGQLWDFNAGVKYQIVDFFGVGLNYKYYNIDFEVDKGGENGSWNGAAQISWSGPVFLVHFNF